MDFLSSSSNPTILSSSENSTEAKITTTHTSALETLSLTACRSHNIELPISRLPPELIRIILQIIARNARRDSVAVESIPSYSWIRVTHIYHYWRTVALGDGELWSTLTDNIRDAAFVEELLERSRDYPLKFYITNRRLSNTSPTLPVLLTMGEKASHLSMVLNSANAHPNILILLGSQKSVFPALKTLSISIDTSAVAANECDTIRLLLEGRKTPTSSQLASFQLTSHAIPWKALLFLPRTLTNLTLSDSQRQKLGDIDDLLQCLSRLRKLRYLSLCGVVDRRTLERSRIITVHLPSLSTLCITEGPAVATALLCTLILPDEVSITIRFEEKRVSYAWYSLPAQPSALLGGFLGGSNMPIHLLDYRILEPHGHELVFYTSIPHIKHSISLITDDSAWSYFYFLFMFKITKDIPMTGVRTLRWTTANESPETGDKILEYPEAGFNASKYSLYLFTRLENLEELMIWGIKGVFHLMRWLTDSQKPLSFPRLRTLRLCDMRLVPAKDASHPPHALTIFRRCITSRKLLLPRIQQVELAVEGEVELHVREGLIDAICNARNVCSLDVKLNILGSSRFMYTLPDELVEPLESEYPFQ